jgi:hypothetical protein
MPPVSGTVTDANTGWPLYASIERGWRAFGSPFWNDPVDRMTTALFCLKVCRL